MPVPAIVAAVGVVAFIPVHKCRLGVLSSVLVFVMLVSTSGGAVTNNGVASQPPTAILQAANAAITASRSVDVSGVVRNRGQVITLHLDLVPGTGGEGSMSVERMGFRIIVMGRNVYFKAGPAFWRHFGGGAAAALLKGRWLEAPAGSDGFRGFDELATAHTFFQKLLITGGKTFVKTATTTVDGVQVVGLHDTTHGGTLYVATEGKPYPIEITKPGSDGGHIRFSGFNKHVTITAPAGAINLSQLTASGTGKNSGSPR